jgi:hypothetical protein
VRYAAWDESSGRIVFRGKNASRKEACVQERHMDDDANIDMRYDKRCGKLIRICRVCVRASNREHMRRKRAA